jgi:tRNA 5-methylaminomethyl-2-thiouridine biosynthesis bifunctional protein
LRDDLRRWQAHGVSDDISPRLIWTEDGAPTSGRFGDVYFSREDGLAESRAVFLSGCGLPEAWKKRHGFVVAELGFGTGLNIAALIDLWRRKGPGQGRLHVFSVEGFPLSYDEAARALSAWPELADVARGLITAWTAPTPGFHRLTLPADWGVTLDLAIGPVEDSLRRWDGRADAWFLDGFAPASNPEMWTEAVLGQVAARSAPGARVATFTVAGAVRRGLSAAGFEVAKAPGHGRKRERLEAVMPGTPEPGPFPRVVVMGGGIAGQSTVRALRSLGATVTLVEAQAPGAGASGFPAALVTPRLDVGDAGLAALFAQALERAANLYDATQGAVLTKVVVQLEQMERDAARFDKVAAQNLWPDGDMTRLSASDVVEVLGEASTGGGLMMKGARAVDPASIRAAWLNDVQIVTARVKELRLEDGAVTLRDETGGAVAEADMVVLAAGWGNAALAPQLGLKPVKGQADWATVPAPKAASWGGYVIPTRDGVLFGATHDRDRTDVEADDVASRRNLETLAGRMPNLAERVESARTGRRAAVRATTRDRLPVAGRLTPQVLVLGGLGSRGFALAPLLGEHVAALVTGAPSPLPADLAARVAPDRLTERAERQDRWRGEEASGDP